jgi:HNH/ENDO VII superfamily nuclease
MPHVLDGMGVVLPPVSKNLCPICEKPKHKTTKDKKDGKGELKSIPANLGCSPIAQVPNIPNYTTAAHHLIPANQCLKPFRRLSQMCDAVGYDVNNGQNGLSLPTVGQAAQNVYDGKKYGKLKPEAKMKVAFVVMEILNLQWHVGHHNWQPLNVNTDTFPHPPNYDKLVKLKLRDMEQDFKNRGKDICDPKKDEPGKDVIGELNAESQRIKGKVVSWKRYFVSAMAQQFAKDNR